MAIHNASSDFVFNVGASESMEPFSPSEIFVSNEGREMTEIAVDFCLSFTVANIGIVSNLLVIVVFAKQGYGESMNISMTAIAIWDLFKCIAGSIQRMSYPIGLGSQADAESWENIMVVVMSYFICIATYVSSVLAAYVAVERCLCVTLPFTVKTLLTPRLTLVAMVIISVSVFGCFVVVFGIYDILWVHSPKWNETIAIYRYNDFYKANEGPLMRYYNLSGVIWPSFSFVVIVICTIIIFYQLRKASKFRSGNAASSSSSASSLSDRDRQVVKMLLVIIVIYVVNLFPRIALYMVKFFIEEFYFLREYHNLFIVVCCWLHLFDLTNSTVNLYVFMTMSTNFKLTMKTLFRVDQQNSKSLVARGQSKT